VIAEAAELEESSKIGVFAADVFDFRQTGAVRPDKLGSGLALAGLTAHRTVPAHAEADAVAQSLGEREASPEVVESPGDIDHTNDVVPIQLGRNVIARKQDGPGQILRSAGPGQRRVGEDPTRSEQVFRDRPRDKRGSETGLRGTQVHPGATSVLQRDARVLEDVRAHGEGQVIGPRQGARVVERSADIVHASDDGAAEERGSRTVL
jgi:hypothetical protein